MGKVFKILFMRVGAVVLIVSGVVLVFTPLLVLGVFLMIGAVILWKSATDEGYNNLYNNRFTRVLRHASDHPTPLETLYSAFAEMKTPLGKPYLGKANWLHKHCLIFGSPVSRAHMYAYTSRSERVLYLSTGIFPLRPLSLHSEPLSSRALAEEIFRLLVQYIEDGTIEHLDDNWLIYTAAPAPAGFTPSYEESEPSLGEGETAPDGEGDYAPYEEGEFTPDDTGEYVPYSEGDYAPYEEGEFTPDDTGEYVPYSEGDYAPYEEGEYTSDDTGEYVPYSESDYTPDGEDESAHNTCRKPIAVRRKRASDSNASLSISSISY